MALPTNITVTPNNSPVNQLPRTISASGTNIFERPSYTDRELFTQTTGDIVSSDWNGGATPQDGIIGKCLDGNGTDAYIDTSLVRGSSTFMGVSFWYYHEAGTEGQGLFTLYDSTSTIPISQASFEIFLSDDGEIWGAASRGGSNNSHVFYINTTNNQQYAVKDDQWNHIFVWMDTTQSSSPLLRHISVNGGNGSGTSGYYSGTISSVRASDRMMIGNHTFYNNRLPIISALDGKICNLYWSTNPDFKNHLDKYSNIPTVEVN